MQQDPAFHFQVGRLVGAAEMTATLIQGGHLDASELQEVGKRLEGVAAWFLEPSTVIQLPPADGLGTER